MITNITLENFKCFRQLDINPKLLTVLIGPNGTGKSSVLQALLLLKQSVMAERINYQGEFVNLNSPREIIPNFSGELSRVQIGLQGKMLARLNPEQDDFKFVGSFNPNSISDLSIRRRILPHGDQNLKETLELLRFIPAARGFVRPIYALGDRYAKQISLYDGLGKQEEQLATNLGYGREWEDKLSALLKQVTGTGLRAETVPPQSVEVKSVTPSGAVNIVSEGFGANALILLLHQLITAEKGATILIEEPEIHLHPKAQAELAEVLADVAKADGKQIIMTTHSEYVAGRLLTLVAEGKLTTGELAIYSFLKDERGECSATEIEVTERGQTKGGLTGFDEATRDEMRRYADGLRNRA